MEERVDIVEQVEEAQAPPRRRISVGKPSATTVVAVVVLVTGLGIIAYPTVSDWWNSYHQSRAIATYVAAVQETDPEVLNAMRQEAQEYNRRLVEDPNRFNMTEAEKAEYMKLLDLTGNGVMGYVQINAINVDYPIYHGMDESVLQIATTPSQTLTNRLWRVFIYERLLSFCLLNISHKRKQRRWTLLSSPLSFVCVYFCCQLHAELEPFNIGVAFCKSNEFCLPIGKLFQLFFLLIFVQQRR